MESGTEWFFSGMSSVEVSVDCGVFCCKKSTLVPMATCVTYSVVLFVVVFVELYSSQYYGQMICVNSVLWWVLHPKFPFEEFLYDWTAPFIKLLDVNCVLYVFMRTKLPNCC